MGRVFLLITIVTAAWAQDGEELPLGIVRGKVSEPESSGLRGRFLLTAESAARHRCSFDERTWFESQRVRVSVTAFGLADPVEVLVDQRRQTDGSPPLLRAHRPADGAQRARPAPAAPGLPQRDRTHHPARGDLAFSGVVTRLYARCRAHQNSFGPGPAAAAAPRYAVSRRRKSPPIATTCRHEPDGLHPRAGKNVEGASRVSTR
jgi:hypothetical protein